MLLNPFERYMKEKGIKEGMEKGVVKDKLEDARRMLDNGFSLDDDVVDVTGFSTQQIMDIE